MGKVLDEALSKALAELEPALRIDWSNTDELDDVNVEVVAARSLLETIAETAEEIVPSQWHEHLPSLEAWVRAETDEHFGQIDQLPMRLKLIGVLFGSDIVLRLLQGYIR